MTTGIILAAGKGTRVGTDTPKQFLPYRGRPLVCASLSVFNESPVIDDIVLVTSEEYTDYCRTEIVERHAFSKVNKIVAGGRERYDSVWNALMACPDADYVLIHDSARPFVTEEIVERAAEAAKMYGAAAVGMPSKDTVKIADSEGFAETTPPRDRVWTIQTPQAFSRPLLVSANELLMKSGQMNGVTDDAMIVETSGLARVKLVEGSYENVKITTPADLKRLS